MSYLPISSARIVLGILGILGAFFAPPWVPLLVIILLAVRYPAWEILVVGLLVDFLWLPGISLQTLPLFTIVGLVLVWGLAPLRSELLIEKGGLV